MLLSDRDIKAELDSGRIGLEPYEPAMIQPSSIDVRLDRFFRLFLHLIRDRLKCGFSSFRSRRECFAELN